MNLLEDDTIEAALDALGVHWKKRDHGWVLPATARTPCEIDMVINDDEVVLEAVLTSWDEAGTRERDALRRMLDSAGREYPGVWFMMSEKRASVIAAVPIARLEPELALAVGRLFTAARLLSRESAAMLETDMADRYLSFFGVAGDNPGGPGRN